MPLLILRQKAINEMLIFLKNTYQARVSALSEHGKLDLSIRFFVLVSSTFLFRSGRGEAALQRWQEPDCATVC